MQCRACLQTNCENTIRFDDLKIMCFNLITNLSISKDDNMPQQLCQTCTRELTLCVEFRQKCISSNVILLSAQTKNEDIKVEPQFKQEYVDDDMDHDASEINYIEMDTKEEIQIENEYVEANPSGDNFVYEFVADVKKQEADEILARARLPSKKKTRKPRAKLSKHKTDEPDNKAHESGKLEFLNCGLCPDRVEVDKLRSHLMGHEHDAGAAGCGVCALRLPWKTLLRHRITHLEPPHLICHVCLHTAKSRASLRTHYKKHDDVVACGECGKRYRNARNLDRHVRAMHDTTKLHCDQCDEVLTSAHALRNHENKTHRHKCSACEFTAETRSGLRQHILRVHAATASTCELCRAAFVDAVARAAHVCRMRAPSHAATVCNICGRLFHKADKLKKHLTTHTGELSYKCEECGVAYRTWRALRVHRNKHAGVRPHACEYCPATFSAMPTLVKHRRVHTGERPYVCKMCGKGFSANHNLKLHMRVHGVYDLIKKKTKDNTNENPVDNNTETTQN
ncbi:zinc finger protein 84-like isoform X2 [Aricia agestis]|uniref:zinc finger protein 84-like isoform X2 n=1 Tax=Aricia agestis TaxID=91739 RepID=UPI001C20365C|nr:zinc finger protein 84-like isoform X2 [Aricia agestis]